MTDPLRPYYVVPKPLNRNIYVRSIGHFHSAFNIREAIKRADFAEFFWCIEGSASFRLNGQLVSVKKNETWYYPAGSVHDYWPESNGFHYWWVTLAGKMADDLCRSLQLKPGSGKNGPCPVELFHEIDMKIRSSERQDHMDALAALFKIMTRIAVPAQKIELDSPERKAHDIIDMHFTEVDLNIEKIAQILGVSRVVLSRDFSKTYHMTISEYLRNKRIQKAFDLLGRKEYRIHEIAELSGFSTQDYFAKVILRHTGESPSEIRKKLCFFNA